MDISILNSFIFIYFLIIRCLNQNEIELIPSSIGDLIKLEYL